MFGKSILDNLSNKKPITTYKGEKVEDIQIKIKCPFCDNIINMEFDPKKCTCVFNPETQKYEMTHSVMCYKCGNEVKNVTVMITRKKGGWSVS